MKTRAYGKNRPVMEIFSRFRNRSAGDNEAEAPEQAPSEILPAVNQRVAISRPGIPPVVTRVDDETETELVLSLPTMPLQEGESVYLTWEEYGRAFTFETTVTGLDLASHLPTLTVSRAGRMREMRESFRSGVAALARPLSIKIVVARELPGGQVLNTETVALSPTSLRFTTSAPLAAGDTVEASVYLDDEMPVHMRCRVVRLDSMRDSWRRMCTVAVVEMLRSDRSRLMEALDSSGLPAE